jgi:hypothetical protein
MTSRFLIWLCCAGALVLACGPRVRSNEAAIAKAAGDVKRPQGSGKMLATSVDVTVRDGVTLALHVTNTSDKRVEMRFRSGQTHDFIVLDSAGREVWRWSADRMFTQALQNELLDPRETISYEEHWDAAGRVGRFTAVAVLTSSNYPVKERVEFTLP